MYLFLFIFTMIAMNYVISTRLPDGGRPPYLFLIWNTFLAWVPLGLAVVLDGISLLRSGTLKLLLGTPVGLLWLFFYPNTAYLITDMLHPFARYPINSHVRFWQDNLFWDHLFTLLFVALLGIALGCVSLASVQRLIDRAWGRIAGWVFAVVVLMLSSFGIYLGRFIRWNSWDVLRTPKRVLKETLVFLAEPANLAHVIGFCKWIFLITLFCYVLLHGFYNVSGPLAGKKQEEL